MKIVVSKSFLKWKKGNKNNMVADAVDKFLVRVYNAADITKVSPQPKSVGNNLGKNTGTVNEFILSRCRVYSKCMEITPGELSFCVANVGVKGVTDQNDDIMRSQSIIDDVVGAGWKEWKPSEEQIAAALADESVIADDVVPDDDAAPAKSKKAAGKKRGKPVDENGMTAAERKALRKQQQQQEQQQQRQAKQAKEAAKAKKAEAQTAVPAGDGAVATKKSAPKGAPVVRKPVVDIKDIDTKKLLSDMAEKLKPSEPSIPIFLADDIDVQELMSGKKKLVPAPETDEASTDEPAPAPAADATAPEVPVAAEPVQTPAADATAPAVENNAAAPDDISDDEIRLIQTTNKTDAAPQKPIVGDVEFTDYADVHYSLELIDHQMRIKKLQIKATQYEIALEELEIKKLQLLQMQKMKGLQK